MLTSGHSTRSEVKMKLFSQRSRSLIFLVNVANLTRLSLLTANSAFLWSSPPLPNHATQCFITWSGVGVGGLIMLFF